MTLAIPFVLALVVSATLTPIGRTIARRLGWHAKPVAGQTSVRTKALFGGVAIGLTLFITAGITGNLAAAPVLLICSGVLMLVGAVSDLYALKPSTKLVIIIVIASVFLFFDYRLQWADSIALDRVITLFWIVGVTSVFNLLDSLDGLCGGIALIAGTAFLLTVLPVGTADALWPATQYLLVLLGAIAGFLIYNVHPASVVMGESGSLLVGLNMAAMTLQFSPGQGRELLSIVAVPVLVLLIPIADAALTAIARLRPNPLSATGRDEPSHRLVAIGLSERAAVTWMWLLAAVSGTIGVIAGRSDQGFAGLAAATLTIGIALFAMYLARVRVHENVDPDRLPATIVPLGSEVGYRRRLAEVLLDLLLISVAYYGAYRLRFEGTEYALNAGHLRESFPIVLGLQMFVLLAVGVYRGMWRYFSLSDSVTFAKGVCLGILSSQAAILYLYRFDGYSLSVFVVYGMLLLLLLVGSRASFRLISEFAQRQRHAGRRLVIYGADDAGATAVRHVLNDARSAYRIIGFIDDDVRKRNVRVHGYRVIGGYDHLVGMIMGGEIDAVAMTQQGPASPGLAALCAKHGVTLDRVAVDWREISVDEALSTGTTGVRPLGEARVVPFTAARALGGPTEARVPTLVDPPVTRGEQIGVRAVRPDGAPARPIGAASGSGDGIVATPIRVAHVITRLILGGAQENTIATAIGQHRDPRFDVTVVCGVDEAGEGNMFDVVSRSGVHTVVIPSLVREIRPLSDVKAFIDLRRFLRDGRYEIVHTHSSKAGIIGRLAARAAGVPIVVHTLHGVVFHEYQSAWKASAFVAMKRICAPLTDTIITVSSKVSEAALAKGIGRPDQYVTVFSGIELELFLSVRNRLSVAEAKRRVGIPPEAPVVGKIARLFPLKGHEQFLAAAVKIADAVPDVQFLLVGDGPLRDELRAEADRLGLQVTMTGRVPPEAVPEYIQAMDVVVHTSLHEGIARVLPQAGAVGKPVVTFDLDGAPEVVHDGVSGFLVRPLETDGVADRTVDLLRDPARCRAFGEAGRAFATEHFSVERMVDQISAIYLDRVARRPGANEADRPVSRP